MDDTPCFNKKAIAKNETPRNNNIKEALKQKIDFDKGTKNKNRKHSHLTDEETICATVVPGSDNGDFCSKEKIFNPVKSMVDINATYSDHPDYSNLMPSSSKHSEKLNRNKAEFLQTFSCKDLDDPKEIVENFLMRQNPMKANKPRNSMVFTRLHNQALVMQKKKAEVREKSKKKKGLSMKSSTKLNHSRSGVLKSGLGCAQSSHCAKVSIQSHRKSDSNNIEYDANAGHRLYLKSRCLSNKRERSLKKVRKEKLSQANKEKEQMIKTSLTSPQSQWILDEKKYGHHYNTDREWNKKDLLDNFR